VSKHHKFESAAFDAEQFLQDVPTHSPKMAELLNKIEELDAEDLKNEGRLFKHFIFSDVKLGGTGAKIIASGLTAKGFDLAYTDKLKLKSDEELLASKQKNFILLASTTVFKKNISVGLKKHLLSKYNERPKNVYGDLARIIVMDSGFKEGIDLFDVKYVHIFEPQTSKADQKQVIGRATRTCGQSGLVFHPSKGWPLHVFIYDINIPQELQERYGSDSMFKVYMQSTGIDLRKIVFADELEKTAIVASADYELNKNVHNFQVEDDTRYDIFEGGSDPDSDDSKVSCSARNCGTIRPNKNVPVSTALLSIAAIVAGESIPKVNTGDHIRVHYCGLLRQNKKYCATVREAHDDPINFVRKHSDVIINSIHKKEYRGLKPSQRSAFLRFVFSILPRPSVLRRKKGTTRTPESSPGSIMSTPKSSPKTNPADKYLYTGDESGDETVTPSDIFLDIEDDIKPIPHFEQSSKNNFLKVRSYVRENLMEYMWPKVVMENQCGYTGPIEGGATPRIMKLTPTQGFVSAFFTPQSSIKGMLLQHSVGTGKTCTAIATATKTFEKEGYTILWVTRTSLKSDIWKNAFEQICHEGIKEKVQKGEKIPAEYSERMRLLSKAWAIRPMSYKQFSNLVAGKNALYKQLVNINGTEDPLRKTLLIIDEAHKLYGGTDLSSIERPDMKKLHASIMKSYETSKENSVRVLLMTATPITNDAMEQIKLLNLLRDPQQQLPENYEDFAKVYLDDSGKFTKKGKYAFLNAVAGQISYLDRSRDARTFSQPIIQHVSTPMSTMPDSSTVPNVDDIAALIAASKKEQAEIKKEIAATKKRCVGLVKNERTECLDRIKDELQNLVDQSNKQVELLDSLKAQKASAKKQLSAMKTDVSQDAIISTRCRKTSKKTNDSPKN